MVKLRRSQTASDLPSFAWLSLTFEIFVGAKNHRKKFQKSSLTTFSTFFHITIWSYDLHSQFLLVTSKYVVCMNAMMP